MNPIEVKTKIPFTNKNMEIRIESKRLIPTLRFKIKKRT
jgi:hypothetical protein